MGGVSSMAKVLAFAGSARKDSVNKKLIKIASEGAREAGVETTLIDLRDFPLPIYDGDFEEEEGLPEKVRELKRLFLAHQGLLISSPEYNSSFSPILKNTIDWVSRPSEGEAPLACFSGKCAAIMSASPGALGGLRGLVHLRALLGNIQVLVLPNQVAVGQAFSAFNEEGQLIDGKRQAQIKGLGAQLAEMVSRLRG